MAAHAGDDEDTPLPLAARQGKLAAVQVLLDHGGVQVVHVRNKHGWTPLHAAVLGECPDIIRLLLEHGADATAQDNDYATPLHLAAQNGKFEAVRVLLELGASTHERDKMCKSAFELASTGGHQEIIELLSKHL